VIHPHDRERAKFIRRSTARQPEGLNATERDHDYAIRFVVRPACDLV